MLSLVFRSYIYPLMIRYNPAFQLFMSPLRDFQRTMGFAPVGSRMRVARELLVETYKFWVDPQASVIRKRLGKYGEGPVLRKPGPDASVAEVEAWKLNIEMMSVGAIWSPFESFARSSTAVDGYDLMMQKFNLAHGPEKQSILDNQFIKAAMGLLRRVEFIGQFFEALPKVAGYKVLAKDLGWKPEAAALYVRNNFGVPNFTKRGKLAWVTNSMFPFFTVALNGWESAGKQAAGKVAGNTAGHWWMSWMVFGGGLYMILQTLAEEGALGEDLRNFFAGVATYDKEQGLILPMGVVPGGDYGQKVAYFKMPQDETYRMINGLMRYGIKGSFAAARGDTVTEPWDAFRFASGQIPSVNPLIKTVSGWQTFLSGQNPVDDFRGNYLLSKDEQLTRGADAWTTMVGWTMGNAGITNFIKYDKQANTTLEMAVGSIWGLNRVLKVTDSGYRAGQSDVETEMDRTNALIRLSMSKDVQQLAVEYGHLSSIHRQNLTPDQFLRLQQLKVWYRAIYSPYRDAIRGAESSEQKDTLRQNIRSASEGFKKP